jgi:hypothetical protein
MPTGPVESTVALARASVETAAENDGHGLRGVTASVLASA